MEESNPTRIDLEGAIDLASIKAEIEKFGSIRITQPGNPFELFINITPCLCGSDDCKEEVVTVHRVVGLSQISWILSSEELTEFKSLNEFYRAVQIFGPDSSSGERQIIERHIRDGIGKEYFEIEHAFCSCKSCAEKIGETELWQRHLLTSLAISFQNLEQVRSEVPEEDRPAFMADFDAGYSLGRLVGEYFLKARVEDDALRGIAAKEAIKARTDASGQSSMQKRHQRVAAMLSHMEIISKANPAVIRLGIDALAELAIEDAANEDPQLWSQGRGQKQEYLDEIRSDIRYRDSFLALTKNP